MQRMHEPQDYLCGPRGETFSKTLRYRVRIYRYSSYKRVRGRRHTVEERISMQSHVHVHKPCATSQPSLFSHTHSAEASITAHLAQPITIVTVAHRTHRYPGAGSCANACLGTRGTRWSTRKAIGSYERVKARSHTVEERMASPFHSFGTTNQHSHRPHATSHRANSKQFA